MEPRPWHFIAAIASVALLFTGILPAGAQQTAPVPPLIASAKSVFISNGGTDDTLRSAFAKEGDANLSYDDFYAAMKAWGHYTLVPSPADAELVMEIRVIAPYDGKDATDPQWTIRIFDEKTHFLLWSFSEPLQGAFRKSTFEKNMKTSVDAALVTLKELAASTTP